MIRALLLTIISCCISLPAAADSLQLPNLSDSASTLLSESEQRKLGQSLYHQLADAGMVSTNEIATRYIQKLGQRLVSQSGSELPFTFFVVNSPEINAFAMLGGYIGVNSGLILASSSESELASVLAHEVAHVTQHHLLRGVEKANQAQLPLTAALLAAILLGDKNPQLAEAAIISTIAGGEQLQLNFTRAHEQEADRLSIEWLTRAGFDPNGMAQFFQKLQQESRYYSMAPEFLSTHPITTNRIADALGRSEAQLPHGPISNSQMFHSVRAILASMETATVDKESSLSPTATPLERQENDYLKALHQIKGRRYPEALQLLSHLIEQAPTHIPFQISYSDALIAQGSHEKAIEGLTNQLRRHPHHPQISRQLAQLLLATNDYPGATNLLKKLIQRVPDDIRAYQLLARIEGEQGHYVEAHLALAEAYILSGRLLQAREELSLALERIEDNFYLQNRIESRLHELNQRIPVPTPKAKESHAQ